jgi:hypothetical protein
MSKKKKDKSVYITENKKILLEIIKEKEKESNDRRNINRDSKA